jgi:hypothetical protein
MIDLIIPILGAITILVGVGILIVRIYFSIRSAKSERWEQTTGVILSSTIENSMNPTKDRFEDYSKASIIYKYIVNGIEYLGDRVYFGSNSFSSDHSIAQSIIKKYPTGKIITVFYDPDKHKDAVIERTHRSILMATIFSILLIAIGAFIILDRTDIVQFILNI